MDSMTAFTMGQIHKDAERMIFDWDMAARLIKMHNANSARAGLEDDWEWTGGDIFKDGKPDTEDYTFLASTWATPEIEINGERFACFIMESKCPESWGDSLAKLKWPESALKIIEGK